MKRLLTSAFFITGGVLFVAGVFVLIWWLTAFRSWTLREQLIIVSPLFLEINFFLIVVAIGINLRDLRQFVGAIPRQAWFFLTGIVVIGLVITVFVAPREHRIFYDEDIYLNIGQNIACLKGNEAHYGEGYKESLKNLWKRFIGRAGMCNEGKIEYGEYRCNRLEYNKEPNGWPYLISVVFRLFGVNEQVGFFTTNALYALSIITVFFIGYLLFGDTSTGIYAALICALIPEFMIWSNTTAVEPSAAFFPALGLFCMLLFLKNRKKRSLFLATVMTAFAIQFRPESIMFLAVLTLVIISWGRDELKRGDVYFFLSNFFILIIPHIVHLYAVKDMGWGSTGPKFSFKFFSANFKVNGLFYLNNLRFPVLFTTFFVLGLVFPRISQVTGKSNLYIKEKMVLLLWFLLFWGIFLFFYAGSYNYGADVRFSLLSYLPFALVAGYGASSVVDFLKEKFRMGCAHLLVGALIVFGFLPFLPFVRAITQEAWGARADHRFAQEMAKVLPDDSLVLTHNPNMFLLWGKSAAQASLATEHSRDFKRLFYQYRGGLYFHYNFWCNVPDPLQNSFCQNILNRYACTEVLSFKEQNYNFVLYKVEQKRGTD